jgi:hypothetical protein
MTREDFRRELGDAFDSISGSPSPALPDRVRSALTESPEPRGPIWIAALATVVIAVILVGVLLVANPLNRGSLVPGGQGSTTPSASPAASPSPSPSSNPSPEATPFNCGGTSALAGYQSPLSAFIDRVQTGTHAGYDRLTIEFQNGQPSSIDVSTQANTKFTKSPSGLPVTLAGKDGVLVTIKGSDGHTAFSGSTDIKTGYKGLVEVRELQDFEGTVQWGLGLSATPCFRAFILTNPTRLVIDIQTS